MIGDDELAILVRALTFQLIDPTTGAVAGALVSGTDAAMFPAPLPATFNGLEMYHRDAATTDSSLRWTHDDAGNETVQLTGPAAAGAASANRPRLYLSRLAAGDMLTELNAGDTTGGTFPDNSRLRLQKRAGKYVLDLTAGQSSLTLTDDGSVGLGNALTSLVDVTVWSVGGLLRLSGNTGIRLDSPGPMPVRDTTGANDRGSLWGENFQHINLAAGTPITNTGTTLISMTPVVYPVAGGWIDITATIVAQLLVINDQLTLSVLVDGAVLKQAQWNSNGAAVNTIHTLTARLLVSVGAGTHTITFGGASLAVNGFQAIGGVMTSVSAIYHR